MNFGTESREKLIYAQLNKKKESAERHRLTSSLAVGADDFVVVRDGNDETTCQSSGKLTSSRNIKELFYCNKILKFCVNTPIIPTSSLKNIFIMLNVKVKKCIRV